MNMDRLTSLIAANVAGRAERSPACPEEGRIAGYVDGGLAVAAREEIECHLADCGHCLALVGLLCRERRTETPDAVPDEALAHARALVRTEPPRRWRLAPQWAAAAMLVLAVPLLLQIGRNPDRGVEGQGRPEPPATRNVPPSDPGLRVLSPAAGATVEAWRLAFHWTEVAGTPFYDVRIVTDEGDVVVEERVDGTTWQPPAQLELQPGVEYFVHVDAYPSGDKASSSDHVPFRVSE